jgi:serine/threonine protein kinase
MNHLYIVGYIEHFYYESNIVIVMEFIEGKSLREIIDIQLLKKLSFSEELIYQILIQMISALSFCQNFNINYLNIKP